MYNDTYRANKGHQAMDLILQTLCMVLCNRVPKGLIQFRMDGLSAKIKLVNTPKGMEAFERVEVQKVPVSAEHPTGEQEVRIEKNTNERAVVRILVPKRAMTLSEINAHDRIGDAASETPAKEGEGAASEQPSSPVASSKSKTEAKADTSAKDASASQLRNDESGLQRQPSERIIETDQEDRAVAVGNRINLSQAYMVLVMNQYAARAHR